MICSICQSSLMVEDFHAFFIVDMGTRPHHLTCRSLKGSVEAGCYACNRLWAVLNTDQRRSVTSSAEREVDSDDKQAPEANEGLASDFEKPITTIRAYNGAGYGHAGSYLLSVSFDSIMIPSPVMAEPRPYWSLSLLLKPRDGSEAIPSIKRHSPRTDSAESLLLAKSWIMACIEEHDQCKASRGTETKWYPTRLIDCGTSEDVKPLCRLIVTNDVALHGPYMTLSHCWGLVECLSLTTENYELLLGGIPFEDLPQLYQDAIYVTRYLGVRYLWIDSLCIMQKGDGLADWHHEATLMNKVYWNSFCNISATHAPNGHYSMFSSRNPDALYPQSVDLRLDGRTVPHLVLDFSFWETEVSRALINTRAWVLQERLLSPRVLHFGERQVLWECESKDAAEIHPEDMLVDLSSVSWSFTRFKGFAIDQTARKPGDLKIYLYWAEIVKAYTACKLTFPGDKLIALSAVAKRVMWVHGDEYIAGMWRRYLERELIWSVSVRHAGRGTCANTRPAAYRAPSWSWAAADGDINPGLPYVDAADILIKVHDFHLEYATDDPTGVVTGGWLRLWGVLKPLLLTPYHSPTAPSSADWEMVVNGIPVSVPSDSLAREPQPHVMLDRPHADFEEQNANSALFCMPVRMRQGDDGSLYVLLLEMLDLEKRIFRRIGMARGWGRDVRQKVLARNQEEDKLPCEEYRNDKHLIRMI